MNINKFNNFVLEDITVGEFIEFLSQYDKDTKISFNDHPMLHVSVNSSSDGKIECYAMNPEGVIPNFENDDTCVRMEDMVSPSLSTFCTTIEKYAKRFGAMSTAVKVNGKSRIKIYRSGKNINFTS